MNLAKGAREAVCRIPKFNPAATVGTTMEPYIPLALVSRKGDRP